MKSLQLARKFSNNRVQFLWVQTSLLSWVQTSPLFPFNSKTNLCRGRWRNHALNDCCPLIICKQGKYPLLLTSETQYTLPVFKCMYCPFTKKSLRTAELYWLALSMFYLFIFFKKKYLKSPRLRKIRTLDYNKLICGLQSKCNLNGCKFPNKNLGTTTSDKC